MQRVLVLNGPNLGQLGKREPDVYGHVTYAELADHLVGTGGGLGLEVEVRQTDAEHEMIGWLHEAAEAAIPVVVNPAGWTHYSIAIADAVVQVPEVIEVHISNVHAREEFRHKSLTAAACVGVVAGLGLPGYRAALEFLAARS